VICNINNRQNAYLGEEVAVAARRRPRRAVNALVDAVVMESRGIHIRATFRL